MNYRVENVKPLEATPKLSDYLIPSNHLGLPFDLKIRQDGRRIERLGEKIQEDKGRRLFIIPTPLLSQFYAANNHSSEELYRFLKKEDAGGRKLALGDDPFELDKSIEPDYTLIVKLIDHGSISRNRWRSFDLARYVFHPGGGLEPRTVERLINWYGDKLFNLSAATSNAPVHIAEPYLSTMNEREKNWKRDKEELENINRLDNRLFIPGTSTLLIKPLRDKLGSLSYFPPPFDAYIFQEQGIIYAKIVRDQGDQAEVGGLNCISVNGKDNFFYGGENLKTALLQKRGSNNASFFYNGKNPKYRQLGLSLDLMTDEKGVVWVTFEEGINPLESLPYNPSAGIIKRLSPEEQIKKDLEQYAIDQEKKAQDEARKQKEVGTNAFLFKSVIEPKPTLNRDVQPVSHQGNAPGQQETFSVLSSRLHRALEELKGRN